MKETVDYSKLITDSINGNNSAFEELYKLSVKTAYHSASLLLSNPDDVEDVLQNSYIKAHQKLPELKNPESFESWIKTIVENECRNYIKKEKRISAPNIFFKNKSEEHSEEWKQPVPQEYMEREELRKNVSDILETLSPEIRACIVLFHYEEKSLNEISEILDIPLGTVKSRLHNGRKQIEKEFNKLRKKDPTLFSIGAIPVILSLLSYQAENIVVPAAISEGGIVSAATTTAAASSAGAAAAGTAATASSAVMTGGAATTAATTIAVKITAVAVAGAVAAGGTVAVKNHIENKAEKNIASSYSTTVLPETCTTSEISTETLLQSESTALTSATIMSTTKISLSSTTQKETKNSVTDASSSLSSSTSVKQTSTKSTTKPSSTKAVATTESTTTTKPTTTIPSTTEETTTETTTEKPATTTTTTEKTTTTTKQTTAATDPPTTAPENNYGASGGVITEYTGSDANISIPSTVGSDTVTAIGAGAFSGNTSIKSVSVPSTVTQIGQEAFADCSSLSSVSLPSSLELIGIGAFYGCSSLTSISVPNGTKTISDEAFAQCSSLASVTIPSSVTSIADDAFDGCGSLTIRCEEGSAAHDFAVANNLAFVLM